MSALSLDNPILLDGRQALGQLRVGEARRRVERNPADLGARYDLGSGLLEAGQLDEAIAELQQAVTELAMDVSGHYAHALDQSTPDAGDNFQPVGPQASNGTSQDYFNTRKVSIYAGSNEIQRNIMAKLVLGL